MRKQEKLQPIHRTFAENGKARNKGRKTKYINQDKPTQASAQTTQDQGRYCNAY